MIIKLLPDNFGHSDLFVEMPEIGYTKVVDTYYFALDAFFMENDESRNKVILNLKVFFECWIDRVANIQMDQSIILPFDFSDEYLGCICFTGLEENFLEINCGYTTSFKGSGVSPSQLNEFLIPPDEYISETQSFVRRKNHIIDDLAKAIRSFGC